MGNVLYIFAAKKFMRILVSDRAEIRMKVYLILILQLPTLHVNRTVIKKNTEMEMGGSDKIIPIYEHRLC